MDRTVQHMVSEYTMRDDNLYRRTVDDVLFKCLDEDQANFADVYDYHPKNINGRWSVDIVLRTNMVQIIFRHASFAEKQGGMC